MKKIILTLTTTFTCFIITYGQQWVGNGQQWTKLYTKANLVGIGDSEVENVEQWGTSLQVSHSQHSKFIAKGGAVYSGLWSNTNGYYGAPAGGITGTWSNHPFSIITNKRSKLTIDTNGNVGIGTNNPQSTLHVYGNGPSTTLRIHSNTNGGGFGSSRLEFWSDPIGGNNEWRPGMIISEEVGDFTGRLSFYTNGSGDKNKKTSVHVMSLVNKKVGIGTLNPDEALTVNGNIHAKEVRIDLDVPADYVFQKYFTGNSNLKPDYKLLSISEVEEFIKKNHRLPQIPSAKEIKEKGLNLGEMNNLLLQKIEELTLYSIEQNKINSSLNKKNEEQGKLIQSLSERLEKLEKSNK